MPTPLTNSGKKNVNGSECVFFDCSSDEVKEPHVTSVPLQGVSTSQSTSAAGMAEMRPADIVSMLLNFEVKEVCAYVDFSCFCKINK